jgi:hypothetical protein
MFESVLDTHQEMKSKPLQINSQLEYQSEASDETGCCQPRFKIKTFYFKMRFPLWICQN